MLVGEFPKPAGLRTTLSKTPGAGDLPRAALSALAGRPLRGFGPFPLCHPGGDPVPLVDGPGALPPFPLALLFYPGRGISLLFQPRPAVQAGPLRPCPYRGSRTAPGGMPGRCQHRAPRPLPAQGALSQPGHPQQGPRQSDPGQGAPGLFSVCHLLFANLLVLK